MISIRNARADDIAVLTEIGLRAWQKAMAPIGETAQLLANARAAFRTFVENDWLAITVVERDGVPAGWAAREALDEVITDFWIDPDHARQGLGTALLADVEREVREQGYREISLTSHARNDDAVGFFEKNGYRVRWLSVAYAPKLDRDVESVGLSKSLVDHGVAGSET